MGLFNNRFWRRNRKLRGTIRNQRKPTREALRFTQVAVDQSPMGIFWVEEDARISYVNQAACESLGYSYDEMTSKKVHDFDPDFPREKWPEHIQELKEVGSLTFESHHRTKEGQVFPVEITSNYLQYKDRGYLCAFVRDITERKRAEEALRLKAKELERSNKELDHFAYLASHDLQEPLRKIITFGELITGSETMTFGEKELNYFQRMIRSAKRMRQLVDDLLKYARFTTMAKSFERVNIEEIIRDILVDLDMRIKQLKAQIDIGPLPEITASRDQIREVFLNLLSNALKFCKEDEAPQIRVRGRHIDGEWIEIRVEDNGIGFDEEYIDKIFRPFQRLHTWNEYEGTGIGLSSCQKIMDGHGGTITATSTLGQGSIFFLIFPKR